ncbi:HAD-IC family P-type ATPase [Helcococcus bovis]|uniref:HAD-IC family P-type ATPase n=1 Tax=Helcococcus bovis TaxID=3153252 RepID=UPI0038B8ADF8
MKEKTHNGLTTTEVEKRRAEGLGNDNGKVKSKSTKEIVFSHVFTLFNILNFILLLVIIGVSVGDWQYIKNGLFFNLIVINTFIGFYQEIRARNAVEKLTLITQDDVVVIRDGKKQNISPDDIVLGDYLIINAGEQLNVDAKVIETEYLQMDESLLTGESNAINKLENDELLAGSFVLSGKAVIEVTKVGKDTFASKILNEAKQVKKSRSQIMKSLNFIVKILIWVILIVGLALISSKLIRLGMNDFKPIVVSTVAALVGMIPEGLVLLTSIAFAVGVIRLSKSKILLNDMSSIETLARIDTLCLDKTGTITSGNMKVSNLHLINDGKFDSSKDDRSLKDIISQAFFKLDDNNATATAIKNYLPLDEVSEKIEFEKVYAFSSDKKWSGVNSKTEGTWIFGAPEFVLNKDEQKLYASQIDELTNKGLRVLVVAHTDSVPGGDMKLSEDVEAIAFFEIEDELRENAQKTLEYFHKQGVDIKIISGDSPKTVNAISKRAGIDNLINQVDMSKIDDNADLSKIVEENQLFGRVTPFKKQAILEALQKNGHVVAMTGDGVNDVPALKKADCSVAMAQGSEAAKVSSDIVLVENDLASMIDAVYEGRRIINNVERVARLFLTKTVYSALLAVLFIFLKDRFPLFPIQFTLLSTFTIGTPAFFLALRANKERVTGNFLKKVMEEAIPAGLTATIIILLHYYLGPIVGLDSGEQNTISVMILSGLGLIVLARAMKPIDLFILVIFIACAIGLIGAFIFFPKFFFLKVLGMYEFTYGIFLLLLMVPLIFFIKILFKKIVK